ncbi:tetratricopeptide repeat protein [Luteimonas sp. 3794]|uniref:tetratricopeptide repeat protein n=1 Tax=Luteimonas sp. 3794 TaxID=2817730 RepID=UPI00285BEE95|nr:tetratricopeptide repeat protein [Luteimonas sp. 3794]MDR6990098.1 lipopolysaccharide biosynthesis regulator YciM [Luteimonas sp. 3794]
MSKSRMSQQALAAALTTALIAFAAPSMALAQDEGSDRSSRADRSARSADRSERRNSRQSTQKAEALYPNSSRQEPGVSASQRLIKQLNTLSEAGNASDAAKGLPVADEILGNSAANAYDKSMAALLAGQLLLNEDNDRAMAYLNQAIDLGGLDNNNHFQAMLIIAQLQAQEDQYAQALASLDRYITESGSTDAKDQALKGNLLYRLERYPEAIATLKPLVDAGGDVDPQWTQILMASYAESGNSAEATRLAEQVAQATPDDKRSQVNLAVSYLQTDQNDKAIEVFERLRASGQLTEESEYRNLYALYLNSDNKEREAIAVINEGLQKNILKEDYRTMAALGQANYFSDQIEPAIAAWRKAAPLAETGDTYLNLARALHQEGRAAEAKEAARQAIAKGLKSNTDAERILSGR